MADELYLNEIVGCIHIHSVYSDGTGTIAEISREAEEAGLDYIMITDHNNLRALANGEEKWYGRILTLIGYEINDYDDANHYLAFGLKEEINKNLSATEYVKRVKEQGGFGIIAHPDESRHLMLEHPPYPWTAWESSEYQGIEIWNQMSEWMEGLTARNKVWRFVNPRRSIEGPAQRTLDRWDNVNRKRPVVGIGGVDAHAHQHKMLGGLLKLTIFRYKVQFQTVRTHLLLSEPLETGMSLEKAKLLIYEAILSCRVFVSNYFNGDARDFRFLAVNSHGIAHIGGTLVFRPGTRLRVKLPVGADIRLIREGRVIQQNSGIDVDFECNESGLYRVEVFRNRRAWIYSNHIRINSAQ